ncbi:MAG: hypothetical protein JSW39_06960 [Desulfobacterales bacterium]|nr:MAG: hypothetical protein JSW39_06960 [Desulfobacterales bacterium]
MPVKFNQYWTIIRGRNEEYDKFILKEFIPGTNRLGIHVVAGWSVLVGAYSEIIFESVSGDLHLLETALKDPAYKELNGRLLNYVKNYKTKVLVKTEKKDSYSTDIKEDTVKFNQMWNIISDRKAPYDRFVVEEFYPCMEKLGITVAQEWEVLIGEGPHILCEGRAQDVGSLIGNLQGEAFQRAKRQLKDFVEDYESRILSFHIQKVKGYKSASYKLSSV